MVNSRLLTTAIVSITMAIGPCLASADPGNGKGRGQAMPSMSSGRANRVAVLKIATVAALPLIVVEY